MRYYLFKKALIFAESANDARRIAKLQDVVGPILRYGEVLDRVCVRIPDEETPETTEEKL